MTQKIKMQYDLQNPNAHYKKIKVHELNERSVFLILTIYDNGILVDLSSNDIKATYSIVNNGILLAQDLDAVLVTIENNKAFSLQISNNNDFDSVIQEGELLVEVTIKQGDRNFTLPIAFCIKVVGSIVNDAKVTDKSYGTTAEILAEVAKARGEYETLYERLDDIVKNIDFLIDSTIARNFTVALDSSGNIIWVSSNTTFSGGDFVKYASNATDLILGEGVTSVSGAFGTQATMKNIYVYNEDTYNLVRANSTVTSNTNVEIVESYNFTKNILLSIANGTLTESQISTALETYFAKNPIEGKDGTDGRSITNAFILGDEYGSEAGRLVLEFSDGEGLILDKVVGEKGEDGDSAYQVAVNNGYEGTEAEWLESLKGKDGTNGNGNGTGWTAEQITLLETIGNHLVFTDDSTGQAMFDSLIASLRSGASSGGNSGGDNTGGESGGEEGGETPEQPTGCTITRSLVGCTLDNNTTSVEIGGSYTANVTFNYDTYNIDTLMITMGGANITNSVYKNGVINIPNVTGNVIIAITVSYVETLMYELPEPTEFDGSTTVIDTGCNLYDEGIDYTICVDFNCTQEASKGVESTVFSIYGHGNTNIKQRALALMRGGWSAGFNIEAYDYDNSQLSLASSGKLIITRTINNTPKAYYVNNDGTYTTSNQNANLSYVSQEYNNIILGARDTNGTYSEYFKGTINDFKVYNRVFDETEIKNYLGVI